MKIWPDCVPCIEKMALGICRVALKDEKQVRACMTDVMKLGPLRGEEWNVISPVVLLAVWRILVDHAGASDLMREVKSAQNRKAMEMYAAAKELVLRSPEPLLAALKLAIAGNELDAMVSVVEDGARGILKKLDNLFLESQSFEELKVRLDRASTITYFLDNCGEIVFDKLLIETLLSRKQADITIVTRGVPILNDATLDEARSVGLQDVARLIDNGTGEPVAGTVYSMVSPEVKALMEESDLLIAKGVGNYDALTEEKWLKGRLTMLYHGKCRPCCSAVGANIGDLIIYNF